MSLAMTKVGKETWLACAIRYAAHYGLEEEVTRYYYKFRKAGQGPKIAAFNALYEWDLLDFIP